MPTITPEMAQIARRSQERYVSIIMAYRRRRMNPYLSRQMVNLTRAAKSR